MKNIFLTIICLFNFNSCLDDSYETFEKYCTLSSKTDELYSLEYEGRELSFSSEDKMDKCKDYLNGKNYAFEEHLRRIDRR